MPTELYKAVAANDIAKVQYLLANNKDKPGFDLNLQYKPSPKSLGETLLNMAVMYQEGDVAIYELLKAHGARLDVTDEQGHTALSRAAYHHNLAMVNHILNEDPDAKNVINKANDLGYTPLLYAILHSDPKNPACDKIIDALEAAGAEFNREQMSTFMENKPALQLETQIKLDRSVCKSEIKQKWRDGSYENNSRDLSIAIMAGHLSAVTNILASDKVDLNTQVLGVRGRPFANFVEFANEYRDKKHGETILRIVKKAADFTAQPAPAMSVS